jgi:hypothetical protein
MSLTMRSRIRQIGEKRLLIPLLSLLQKPKHPIREILCRIKPLRRDIRDLLVCDLIRTFRVKRREDLEGRCAVFQEGLIQVCAGIRISRT